MCHLAMLFNEGDNCRSDFVIEAFLSNWVFLARAVVGPKMGPRAICLSHGNPRAPLLLGSLCEVRQVHRHYDPGCGKIRSNQVC